MGIKETPTNFRVYHTNAKAVYTQLKKDAIEKYNKIKEDIAKLYDEICNNINLYKTEFGINLNDYDEFKTNTYTNGSFLKIAKGLFINRKDNYKIVADLFNLYSFALKQKELHIIDNNIKLYDKVINLSLKEYTTLLKTFYNKVHERMIVNGEGYVFEETIGWTCINRCHIVKQRPHINYVATKKRREELLKEGKRIYNKEEAEWCKKNGIEYNAVDPRVYMRNEYCYEIPLLGCKLPNGSKYKLDIADYRGQHLRGLTNEDLVKKYGDNLETICKLDLDVRTKLNLCNTINKMLYLNFIRNENQEPINIAKISGKNRQ